MEWEVEDKKMSSSQVRKARIPTITVVPKVDRAIILE